MYRSKKFLDFTRKRTRVLQGIGENEAHHVKMIGGGGMGLKPPDTHALPIPNTVHQQLDSPGHSERSVFSHHGYAEPDVKSLVLGNICVYLEKVHNIDASKLLIELVTDHMEAEGL